MRLFKSGKWNQYFVGAVGCLSHTLCSAPYVWLNPLLRVLVKPNSPIPMTYYQASWVGSIPEIAAIISPIPVGYLADLLGRRYILLATAPIQAAAWLAIYFTHNVYLLLAVRFVQGLMIGVVGTVLPMYLVEIADKTTRGRLSVMTSIGWSFGCLFEYIVGPFFSYNNVIWINLALPVVFFLMFYPFEESPYFLVMKNRVEEAAVALASFRNDDVDPLKELQQINESIEAEKLVKSSWRSLLMKRTGRKGLLIVAVIVITWNLSGAMAIIVFSSNTFEKMIGEKLNSNLYTIGLGAFYTVTPLVTMLFIDRYGRRPILLISYAGSTLCLIPATVFFFMRDVGGYDVKPWAVFPVVCIALYPTMITFGAMIIGHTYQAELFNNTTRSLASALITLLTSSLSYLNVLLYEPFEQEGWDSYNYLVFSLFALAGFVFCAFYAPETKDKSFEEIQKEL